MRKAAPAPPVLHWPLYWFAVLEKAVQTGAFETASRAQQELKRLGVRVSCRLKFDARKDGGE
jgi:hypothetical protein